MKKIFNLFLIFGILLFLSGSVFSLVSYCCEKTESGAWCQNAPEQECNAGYQKTPTSCESTSYCKMGCCYNNKEGTCSSNTPERVCREDGGIWSDSADCSIPECQLGCCLIGDQAAFVTGTRCKRLANLYGLDIDYRLDIANEFECIASTTSQVKGACVYVEDYQNECKFITQKECKELGKTDLKFYADKLCTAPELNTVCAPTKKTTCIEGKDQIFLLDSCDNIANVYDSTKIDSQEYWSRVYDITESCGYGSSNAGSSTCGNCDYYYGSTCKEYKRGEDRVSPVAGDYICKDLSCTYGGNTYQHGESWCETNSNKENVPGSKYFRLMCYNREVLVEPCAEYRQQICTENVVNGFSFAACTVNKWQDCMLQIEEDDCLNIDRRDCKWVKDVYIPGGNSSKNGGVCVPANAPGFDFWNSEGDASNICSTASTTCVVKYEKKLTGGRECVENCECLEPEWEEAMKEMCVSLGDCGVKTNFIGKQGYNKAEDYFTKK